MSRHRESAVDQGEHAKDHGRSGTPTAEHVADLRQDVDRLSERIHAQLTTIAAHAEIARERVDQARAEARADLERTRDMLIRLIEQVRSDAGQAPAHHVPGAAPGPSVEARAEIIERLEHRVDALAETVQLCFDQQRALADTMAAFLDTMMAERRGEPITGLSLT